MPAINFQPRFADLVESGKKAQTIRKANRFKVGDAVTLYTGQRTKQCRKLGEGVVEEVIPIHLRMGLLHVAAYFRDGYKPKTCFTAAYSSYELGNAIARADGFASVHEMAGWFKDQHGLPFGGWLIKWRLRQ